MQEGVELRNSDNPTGAIVLFKNALENDPNYYEARLQLALAYLDWGNTIQAEKELEKVLLQDPSNGEVLLYLAKVHLKNRAPDKAIGRVQDYLKEQSPSALAFELLAQGYGKKGELAQAEQAYGRSLELDPQHVDSLNGLALLYAITGRQDEARALLKKSVESDPRNKDAYYLLLQLERGSGNIEEAVAAGKHLLNLYPEEIRAAYLLGLLELGRNNMAEVERLATDLGTRHPKHPAGIRLQGLKLYAEGNYAEAVEKLQQSLPQMPDSTGRYVLGMAHYQLGAFELALNQFQAMLDDNPEHAQARLMVAQTLFRQKRLEDSLATAQMVLKTQPNNALAHDILGSVYLAQGDYDRGMEEIDRAIALAPDLAGPQLKKGLANLAQGKLEEAELPLEEVVRLTPEAINARLLLATYYLRQANFPQAVATLQEGLRGLPEDAVLHNHLAAAYLGQKQPAKAVAELEKAKAKKPDYLAPYVNLANYHLTKGLPAKAAEEYRDYLQVSPQNLRALLSLAALQELQGDKDAARESLNRAAATEAVEGFVAQALFQSRIAQPEQALKTLNRGLEVHPKQPTLLELKGKTLLRAGRTKEALDAFTALAEVQPAQGLPLQIATLVNLDRSKEAVRLAQGRIDQHREEPQGYLLLAAIHRQQQNYKQAEAVLQTGLKRVKNALPLQMKLAELYLARQLPDRALQIYTEQHAKYPDSLPVAFALGALQDQQGNKEQALTLYRECLARNAEYVPALNNMAYLYAAENRNLDEALQLAVRAFRLKSAEPGIMDTLGYVLVRNGRFADARPYLEKAASLLPKDPAVQLHLAMAYQGLGESDKAEAAARLVMASGNPVMNQSAEKLLKKLVKDEDGKE